MRPSAALFTCPFFGSRYEMVTIGESDGQSITLSDEARFRGTYVIGLNGTGKSTLLLNMIVQDVERGAGVCVIDPKGDLADDVLHRIPREREQDIVFLDPLKIDYPFPLNVFHCPRRDIVSVQGIVEQVVHIFQKIWADSWGPQLADLLRNSAYTAIDAGLTLVEIPALLEDASFRSTVIPKITSREVRRFWEQTYNKLDKDEQLNRRMSTLNKVREFTLNPIVSAIVGQQDSIDFRQIMDEGKILIVRLAVGKLKDGPTSLLGSVVISQLLSAAMDRIDTRDRKPFFLFADEFQRFAISDFATLIDEARGFRIATLVAHQGLGQLDDPKLRSAMMRFNNKIVFKVSGEDAGRLAEEFDATPPEPLILDYRATKVISRQPVTEMLGRGHHNPKVQAFCDTYLHPIHEGARHSQQYEDWRGNLFYNPDQLLQALKKINDLLVEFMEMDGVDRDNNGQLNWKVILISYLVAPFLGFYRYSNPFNPDPTSMDCSLVYVSHFHPNLEDERKRSYAFAHSLLDVCGEFFKRDNYIWTDGPRNIPVPDRILTTDEVRNRIANDLVNIPEFHAKVTLLGQEAVIQTTLPKDARSEVAVPLIGRPRAEVEAEIESRSFGSDDGPKPGRRQIRR